MRSIGRTQLEKALRALGELLEARRLVDTLGQLGVEDADASLD